MQLYSVPALVDSGSSHCAADSVSPLSCVLRAMSPSMNDTACLAKSLVEGGPPQPANTAMATASTPEVALQVSFGMSSRR